MKSLSILPLAVLAGKCQEKCNSDLEVCLVDCITQSPEDVRCPGDCARAESDCLFRCQDSNYGLFAASKNYMEVNFGTDVAEYSFDFDFAGHDFETACSVEFEGDYYIIGGIKNIQRVSKVSNCGLSQVDFMYQAFYGHRCTNWNGAIHICGSEVDAGACWKYVPGRSQNTIARSQYGHSEGGLVVYDNYLLRIAGYTQKVEAYGEGDSFWSDFNADLPYVLSQFAALVVDDSIFLFGGYSGASYSQVDTILRFDNNSRSWDQIGQMEYSRRNFAIVQEENFVYIAGGEEFNLPFEVFDTETFETSTLESMSQNFYYAQIIPEEFLNCRS
ncbi:Oidioi.mRNA.OKI2018_I69.chr1.g3201.t1.cds [Oikopleura dioica]|uniref:Oidioi.mRNA.OKI2018_I69.chr1.g3201.t1.cds n=1 Tax=Oikopleura dioica TaxID=34765 RepID=A0ABN7T2L4_OIKDI|nr:Oidioi.mRNA.OKI2018_I69.chr1.g3201.t1.cds [Oikopleura dioica]